LLLLLLLLLLLFFVTPRTGSSSSSIPLTITSPRPPRMCQRTRPCWWRRLLVMTVCIRTTHAVSWRGCWICSHRALRSTIRRPVRVRNAPAQHCVNYCWGSYWLLLPFTLILNIYFPSIHKISLFTLHKI
jgi:hypothetical protein